MSQVCAEAMASKRTRCWAWLVPLLGLFFPPVLIGQSRPSAQAEELFSKGFEAYKAGRYDESVELVRKCLAIDPGHARARLYLATGFTTESLSMRSQGGRKFAEESLEEFRKVLKKDPANLSAIDGAAAVLFQLAQDPYDPKKLDASRRYHKLHIMLKPDDAEPYYWVGVINWSVAYCTNRELRLRFNKTRPRRPLPDTDPLPESLRHEFAAAHARLINEGIAHLQQAMRLHREYDDAIAYLSLAYRQKADMVESAIERAHLLRVADGLVSQVRWIKQKRLK